MLERINNNANKIDLPNEYNVSSTFNASDLSFFEVDRESDLRKKYSQEGENDRDVTMSKGNDPLEGLRGHMTRAKEGKAKEAI